MAKNRLCYTFSPRLSPTYRSRSRSGAAAAGSGPSILPELLQPSMTRDAALRSPISPALLRDNLPRTFCAPVAY